MSKGKSPVHDPGGMRVEEYEILKDLILQGSFKSTLEIGMANGESTEVICSVHRQRGEGKHIAIDPFQNLSTDWAGKGVERIRRASLSEYFQLIEKFDYLALPELVAGKSQFDLILIDGWHSFDYTLIDIFYADLLLKPGGVLVIHDTGYPSVYKACRFLETHKPYVRIGPPLAVSLDWMIKKMIRRLIQILKGPRAFQEAKLRRTQWFSLGAYRKRESIQVADSYFSKF